MKRGWTRRDFLGGAIGAGVVGTLGGFDALLPLSPVSAAETTVNPDMVRFTPEIEPVVQLIENTPRSMAVEVLAREVRKGLPYQQFLAALFLAGIRNVNPQPPGFKFHCVFIIHSCNYLSLMAPPKERLLPLFYALDDFKLSQKQDIDQGDFVLGPVKGPLPSGDNAWRELRAAMEDWDEPRADRAITALIREKGHEEVFEGLWEYGARDYRNIGHKIIFVSHAWRTLKTIGWQHAEPTLRSLMLGLLDFGRNGVVNAYAFEDQAYRPNAVRAKKWIDKMPGDWTDTAPERGVTLALLDPLREGRIDDACDMAVRHLAESKCKAGAVWDAVHLVAGEMMMRQPGIIGVHTVTSTNSMHYAFRTAKNPETRLLLLLQGLGWMGQFRNLMDTRRDKSVRITELEPRRIPRSPDKAAESILDAISADRFDAAQQAYAYQTKFGNPDALFEATRRLVFTKSVEHHQYKWPAAVFEDFAQVNPEWRPHMLATAMYYLRGSGHPDSTVIQRAIRELKTA